MNENLKDILKVGDAVEFVVNGVITGETVPDIFIVDEIHPERGYRCKLIKANSEFSKEWQIEKMNDKISLNSYLACPWSSKDPVRILTEKERLAAMLSA
jgi:hypothetical protein